MEHNDESYAGIKPGDVLNSHNGSMADELQWPALFRQQPLRNRNPRLNKETAGLTANLCYINSKPWVASLIATKKKYSQLVSCNPKNSDSRKQNNTECK